MAKFCKIVAYYRDGDVQEYFGWPQEDEKMLHIYRTYPADDSVAVHIPLVSIQRYTTDR